jgi:hypothetical protein
MDSAQPVSDTHTNLPVRYQAYLPRKNAKNHEKRAIFAAFQLALLIRLSAAPGRT